MKNKEELINMIQELQLYLETNYMDDWELDWKITPILNFIDNNF